MVNTAGAARWCGQAIEDGSRIRPGFRVSSCKPSPTKNELGAGQKNHRLTKTIRIRSIPPQAARFLSRTIRIWNRHARCAHAETEGKRS
ncbi:MAG: hypothetical protein CL535_19515 [Ahrensia sp.]|nr:hypothetical protein [Ahrensia sp.]